MRRRAVTGGGVMDTDVIEIASLMLRYPEDDLLAARDEIARTSSSLPPGPGVGLITRAAAWWAAVPADALREEYVATFDLSRRTSLDLTYFTYGDRRQRGIALLGLRRRFQAAGLEPDGTELPDHLPMVLEFAASGHPEGQRLLIDHRPVIELLHLALADARSPFADVVGAVTETLPELSEAERSLVRDLAREGPPVESVGLEPFAPPEVMPSAVREPCRSSTIGGGR